MSSCKCQHLLIDFDIEPFSNATYIQLAEFYFGFLKHSNQGHIWYMFITLSDRDIGDMLSADSKASPEMKFLKTLDPAETCLLQLFYILTMLIVLWWSLYPVQSIKKVWIENVNFRNTTTHVIVWKMSSPIFPPFKVIVHIGSTGIYLYYLFWNSAFQKLLIARTFSRC